MLELKNIKKDYVTASETVHALKGVDLTFRDKEFVSILGPSGCGKTTLLNIIGGLDHYTSGDLVISGRSTKDYKDRDWDVYRNHRVGFIFQSYNLIPHQTILGNVELALTIAGMSKRERVKKAKNALDRVGLRGQYNKRPNQLSGGQCQRVAIARALVNDPEILLADEPTGALDTKTSKQIMNLIREIAGERLVIMVTHNPELADRYSTRIIDLLDGNVVRDTNPVTEKELAAAYSRRGIRKMQRAEKKSRSEKAEMSLWTAFKLSARNLISKKGRTTMVGFAGSIGIIGIALVLAFSTGIKGYIASMQDDMLSGNPISISESTYDLDAITGMMNDRLNEEIKSEEGKVFINSLIKYIMETSTQMDSFVIQNDISRDYIAYLDAMPKEYYAAMVKSYGIDMLYNIYTDFYTAEGTEPMNISVEALTNRYKSILSETDFKEYSSYITTIVPSFVQAPNNAEYIQHQYDVIGKVATEKNEVMLVLDPNDRLSDVLLARLGYYTEEEFINIIHVTNNSKYNK
jgi:putative ABC transport system permease protein